MSAAEDVVRKQVLRQLERQDQWTAAVGSSSGGMIFYPTPETEGSSTSASASLGFRSTGGVVTNYVNYKAGLVTGYQQLMQRQLASLHESLESSPFDAVLRTRVREAAGTVKRKNADPVLRPATAARLDALIEAAQEEYPETEIPSPQSISAALKFLSSHLDIREPSLTLTPSGNVWAQWRDIDKSAALEFLRNGSIVLAAIYPDPIAPWQRTSEAGNYSPWQLGRFFAVDGSLSWTRR